MHRVLKVLLNLNAQKKWNSQTGKGVQERDQAQCRLLVSLGVFAVYFIFIAVCTKMYNGFLIY